MILPKAILPQTILSQPIPLSMIPLPILQPILLLIPAAVVATKETAELKNKYKQALPIGNACFLAKTAGIPKGTPAAIFYFARISRW